MTLAVIPALMVLIALGNWQLDRRVWKEDVLETRAERITEPIAGYAAITAVAGSEVDTVEYRPIRLQGTYRADADIKLLSRTREGRVGFHIITALAIEAGDTTVWVDRGWVPVEGGVEVAPPPEGIVSVDGYVRKFETPGQFTPDNEPDAGVWYYLDGDQLVAKAGTGPAAPFYVQKAPEAQPGIYPVGGVPNIALRNPHLQYAVTWYALAVVMMVIYVIFHIRRRSDEGE